MLAFSNDYYELIFRATQSVELFCAYVITSELTVKFNDDKSFKYMGNKILNNGTKEVPKYQYRIKRKN